MTERTHEELHEMVIAKRFHGIPLNDEEMALFSWLAMNEIKAHVSPEILSATMAQWMYYHHAGVPDVPMFQEQMRRDAMFWAELATHDERAAYFLASSIKLRDDPMSTKQTKVMLAHCFKSMSPDDQKNFAEWAGKQT